MLVNNGSEKLIVQRDKGKKKDERKGNSTGRTN